MKYYVDISIVPNAEFSTPVVMNALYSKFHLALVQQGIGRIGVSFPRAGKKTLGDTLRLHGENSDLLAIMKINWLKTLSDYIQATEPKLAPDTNSFRIIKRIQGRKSPERLRRRSIRKGWLTEKEALEKIPDAPIQTINLPYLNLTSQSSRKQFRLFIDQSTELASPVKGQFSSYGLSDSATVPWF